MSRRQLLISAGLAASGGLVGACSAGEAPSNAGKLTWWDHTPNLQPANKKVFAAFAKEPGGVPVAYTYHPTAKLGQVLQLAKQSKELPDVLSTAGLELPLPALVNDGWFQPIELSDEAMGRLPKDALVDGIHMVDGKVYTIPITGTKQYWAANFFNSELLEKSGLDPANPPKTYDEFRAACRAVKSKGGAAGWIFGLGQTPRVAEQVHYLAQAAGFEGAPWGGYGGIEFRTGEFAYHSDPYVTVVEFLLSLQKDGLMFKGSQTLDDKVARIRWATGVAGFFFDGPWCPGDITRDAKAFADKLDVGPMLVPDAGSQVTAYRTPQGGFYHISAGSKKADKASQLLGHHTTQEYYMDICRGMGPPPLDQSVVEKVDVHPAWKKVIGWFNQDAFIAPVPVTRNPDVQKVIRETKQIKPGLGELVAGMFSGDVTNVRGALKKFSDDSAKERERAIAAAKKNGAKADESDWAFSNWKPRTDYTKDMYG
ncbi:MAG: ABC transporter substrate-binding protein [Micromonosporaceae bacterium]